MVMVVVVDGGASVGRRRCGRHGRQLQLDKHHVITQTHRQIQRSFTRQEIVDLLKTSIELITFENWSSVNQVNTGPRH